MNCIESVDFFEWYGHFNNINFPIHEHGISFHLFVLSSMLFINILQFGEYSFLPSWLNLFLGTLFFLMQLYLIALIIIIYFYYNCFHFLIVIISV